MESLYNKVTVVPQRTVDPKYADLYNAWNQKRTQQGPSSLTDWITILKNDARFMTRIQVMAVFLMISGCAALAYVHHAEKEMAALRNRTTMTTTGTVIGTRRVWRGKRYDNYSTVRYEVGQETLTDEFMLSYVQTGQAVTVAYNPENPREARIEGEEDRDSARSFRVISICMIVIGAIAETACLIIG